MYLKKKGFDIQFKPDIIVATNGNDVIAFKRGRSRMTEIAIQGIKNQLTLQGYDTTDFDYMIIKHHEMIQEKVKMYLFARWIATCYADTHMDDNGKTEHDIGFNPRRAISVLNMENGEWYKTQLKHFNEVVYPNYVKNDSVKVATKFLK